MDNLTSMIDCYVAVWNEPDADARRRRICAIWAQNGTTCYRLLDARGYEAIESRVSGSWDRWLREGKYVFRPVKAVSHHRAVKFDFAMVATDDGKVEANGLCYLLLDSEGRVVHDYQFSPSANDALDLANRYLACWNESHAERRRKLVAELWAEKGTFFREHLQAKGLDDIAHEIGRAHRGRIAKDFVISSVDRSQRHHNVGHISWRVTSREGGLPVGTSSTLLILTEDGRISAAHQFDEPTVA